MSQYLSLYTGGGYKPMYWCAYMPNLWEGRERSSKLSIENSLNIFELIFRRKGNFWSQIYKPNKIWLAI